LRSPEQVGRQAEGREAIATIAEFRPKMSTSRSEEPSNQRDENQQNVRVGANERRFCRFMGSDLRVVTPHVLAQECQIERTQREKPQDLTGSIAG
jgi:hypothetical protein